MEKGGWLTLILVAAPLLAGCIGDLTGDTGPGIAPANTTDPMATDRRTIGQVSCDAAEKIPSQIRDHDESPFADRPQAEAQLLACPDAGVFALAAYGLEGEDVLSMTWEVPGTTTCEGWTGVAATGGDVRYYISSWERPDGTATVGLGSGGGGFLVSAFAGSTDTDTLVPGSGGTAWGGHFEDRTFDAGIHRYTAANNAWGGWDTSLSDGAPLLFLLACEDTIRFDRFQTSPTLEMFHHDSDMDTGAGASAFAVGDASIGRALATELPSDGVLRTVGYAFTGAGALVIEDDNGTTHHPYHPTSSARIQHAVPAGPLTVDLAQTGDLAGAAGAVHGALEAIAAGDVVQAGPSDASTDA